MARSVMVVGGTSGIGLAVARRCVERGDRVTLVARDEARLARVATDLGGRDAGVAYRAADVVDREAVTGAVEHALERHGRLDTVVTTAQAMVYGRVEEVPAAALSRMHEVAVVGTSHLAGVALPAFRAHGSGSLVVVGSLLSQIAVPAMGAYCAAKAAQHALVRTLQQEVRDDPRVRVALVLPGAVDTPIYQQAASYAASAGSAPPPVVGADRVAAVCLAAAEGRTRPVVHVGVANRAAVLGYRWAPWLYDRLAGPLVDRVVLRGPTLTEPQPGNLYEPHPAQEGISGGWTTWGRLRDRRGRARWRRREP
ncbi:SDR family NAD(P)-dependent oxidoreductase [Nocardioides mangrovicus]|uniref:SDR family NAD(P)-dependent oxidoreductase n=1 Tax=Nocardioides mangrovicus TaxID=2478913 RepID=UPI0011C35FFE|nr:SDR family NAD(P)-dependent oxidoreductase [Nocardioides mangrovicus]